MDPASGVIVAQTAAGTSVVLGLMRCGRIWLCPVCAATIRHKRAEEITAAVVEWIKRGGTAYLVTFTARHRHTDRLADLMDALQGTRKTPDSPRRPGAYQRLITGGTWAGRRAKDGHRAADREGIRDRIGYVGMIRATEVTVGQINGWHPHIHAIVLVGGRTEGERSAKQIVATFEPTGAALDEWQGHWRSVWTAALRKVNPAFTPDDRHGVDFKRLETERDANDLAEYIAKTQDGKAPALELARADLKTATGGNVAPFELLGRIGDLTGGMTEDDAAGVGSLEWNLSRWHEYERATRGRRAIEWTRYLRQMLGLDGGDTEADDLDLLLAADADGGELRAGVAVTEDGWHAVTRRALDLEATRAAEGKDGNEDSAAVGERVREVLALADAADTVVVLTAGEVAEAYADMLAALAQRREEATARRRREQDDDQDDDADDRQERAARHIARLASGPTSH
nr:replication protein [Chromogenic Screening-based CRISPR-Cas9 vector pQS-gusA]QGV11378.1 replication protein [Chromogenic Screening-based CRISPR-Cas9 vector pQS-idgS]